MTRFVSNVTGSSRLRTVASLLDGKVHRMSVAIRRAAITDAAEIARIHVETWKTTYPGIVPAETLAALDQAEREQSWRDRLMQGSFPILLALDGEAAIGFAAGGALREPDDVIYADLYADTVQINKPFAELYALYVQQNAHGRGAGRALCRALASELRTTDFGSLLVWVLAANPAVSFYEHLGGHACRSKNYPNWRGDSSRNCPLLARHRNPRRRQLKSLSLPFPRGNRPAHPRQTSRARAG